MAKRWKKPKGQSQQSKVRKPKAQLARQNEGCSRGAAGTLGAFRSGFRGMLGGGKKYAKRPTVLSRIVDVALWAAVAAVAFLFVSKSCGA